jgi:hypothetical protein
MESHYTEFICQNFPLLKEVVSGEGIVLTINNGLGIASNEVDQRTKKMMAIT